MTSRLSGLNTRSAVFALAFAATLAACGDDGGGPLGIEGGFDLTGTWTMSVTDAVTFGRECAVSGITMSFTGTGGTLAGTLDPGGNLLVCTLSNGSTEDNPLPDGPLAFDLVDSGNGSVRFHVDGEGAQGNGGWVITGNGDGNSMSGSLAFRPQFGGVYSTTSGNWTAQRQ